MLSNNIERKLCDIRPVSGGGGFNDERFEYFYTANRDNANTESIQAMNVVMMPKTATGQKDYKNFFYAAIVSALCLTSLAGVFIISNFSAKATAEGGAEKQVASAYQNISTAFKYVEDFDFEKAGFELFEAEKRLAEAGDENALAFIAGIFNNEKQDVSYDNKLRSLISSGLDIKDVLRPLINISAKSIFSVQDGDSGASAGKILAAVFSKSKNVKIADPNIKNNLEKIADYSEFFSGFLGADKPRNFLIVFQNSSELRPTGGFIGSYGVLDAEGGRITKIAIDDIFNLDGQLSYQVVPPKPLQKISTAWSVHDANWFLDFPTSAEKLAFLYEKASGKKVDGVIALNQNAVKRTLKVTGPIEVQNYDFPLSEDNFLNIVKFKADQNYKGENNKPKKIFDDMLAALFEKFFSFSNKDIKNLLNAFSESMDAKDMSVWFEDEKLNKIFSDREWDGKISGDASADYLAVIASNMSGNEGDEDDFQIIQKTSEVKEDGSAIDSVSIKRMNNSDKEKLYYIKTYVPQNSELLAVSGNLKDILKSPIDYQKSQFAIDEDIKYFERDWQMDEKSKTHIFQESGKRVFGNWLLIKPGEKKELFLQYKISLSDGGSAKFIFQRQSGVESMLDFDVILPNGWIFDNPSQESFSGDFNKDLFFDIKFFR